MATTQYIGARYVPKLEGEHNPNRTYEAFSIVQSLNDSYTSKKNVPVGVQISNTEYWVKTGNFNGQVEEYRQDVEELGASFIDFKQDVISEVEKIKEPKYIIIGDSYGTTNGGGTTVIPYPTIIKEKLGWSDNLIVGCQNGAGFKNGAFKGLLDTIPDDNDVIGIYVFGGWNDIDATSTELNSAFLAFAQDAHTKFPNARIGLGFLAGGLLDRTSMEKLKNIMALYRGCIFQGFTFYIPTESICWTRRRGYWLGTDTDAHKSHPNQVMENQIANYLASFFSNGFITSIYDKSTTNAMTPATDVNDLVCVFEQTIQDDIVTTKIYKNDSVSGDCVSFTSPNGFTLHGTQSGALSNLFTMPIANCDTITCGDDTGTCGGGYGTFYTDNALTQMIVLPIKWAYYDNGFYIRGGNVANLTVYAGVITFYPSSTPIYES